MAKSSKSSNGATSASEAQAPDATPAQPSTPQPQWDDTQLRTSYANVCNVFGSREEITLLFGTNQAWQPDSKEVKVALNERIVLTPYTAKRLAMMLEKGLAEYEKRFGEIKL